MPITVTLTGFYINLYVVPVLVPVKRVDVFKFLFLKFLAPTTFTLGWSSIPLVQMEQGNTRMACVIPASVVVSSLVAHQSSDPPSLSQPSGTSGVKNVLLSIDLRYCAIGSQYWIP